MPAYRKKTSKKNFKKKPKGRSYARSSGFRNRAPRASRGFYNRPGELKYLDIAATTYAYNTTGTVTALNLLAVGDDANTRDGRQVTCKSIAVTGPIYPEDGATAATYCRTLLVWDSQPNSGVIATIANILTGATSVSNTNLDNRERFTILRDDKVTLGAFNSTATQATAMSPSVTKLDWFVPLNGVVTTYSGTTAAIGSIATGALLLVTIGDTASGLGCTGSFTTRLRFYDN